MSREVGNREKRQPRLRGWLSQRLGMESSVGLGGAGRDRDPEIDEDFIFEPLPEGDFMLTDRLRLLITEFYERQGYTLVEPSRYAGAPQHEESTIFDFTSPQRNLVVMLTISPDKVIVTVASQSKGKIA